MAQSALERNPALRTPTLFGHPVLTDSLLCPWEKKARNYIFSKFNPLNTGGGAGVSAHNSRALSPSNSFLRAC